MKEYRNSLIYCILFCLILFVLAVYDISSSYSREARNASTIVANNSFLIGKWIKGEFNSSDFVLRDIVSQVPTSELVYPNSNQARQKEITDFIRNKLETLPPNITGVGLVSQGCISTHTYNAPPRPSIIGFDGSSREWCQRPKNDPNLDSFVTNAYLANTNQIVVNQIRRFHGSMPGAFYGLAGFSIELGFFSKWLEQVKIGPHGIIAIADTELKLLARKPALPDSLGKKVNDEIVEAFVVSGDRFKFFSNRSPLDGENRLYGVYKIDDLPFVVVVGEADKDWQADWRHRTWGMVVTLVLLWGMSIFILFTYRLRLRERDALKNALNEIKTLRGIIPICSHCKKIRDDKGYWNQIEAYIQDHSDAEFSHGICQDCAKKYYDDMDIYEDKNA